MFRPIAVATAVVMATAGSAYAYETSARATAPGAHPAPVQLAAAYNSTVLRLQSTLAHLGYQPGPADGLMGPRTAQAIRQYQADNGLLVTGQPSADLAQHMEASLRNRETAQRGGSGSGNVIRDDRPWATETYEQNVSRQLVVDVQSELRRRGYTVTSVDGRFDGETESAIRAFQRDANLVVTGKPSAQLLSDLRRTEAPAQGDGYRRMVADVQGALNERGYDAGPVDGVMGPKTRDAIRTYQVDAGLQPTGRVDGDLIARLDVGADAPRIDRDLAADDFSRRFNLATVFQDGFEDGDFTHDPRWVVRTGSFWVGGEGDDSALWTRVDTDRRGRVSDRRGGGDSIGRNFLIRVLESEFRQDRRDGRVDIPGYRQAEITTPVRIDNAFRLRMRMSVHGDGGHMAFGPYSGDIDRGYRVVYSQVEAEPRVALVRAGNGAADVLARSDTIESLNDGYIHELELRRTPNGRITLLIDGDRVLDAVDNTETRPFDGLSFANYGGQYAMYGIRVEEGAR